MAETKQTMEDSQLLLNQITQDWSKDKKISEETLQAIYRSNDNDLPPDSPSIDELQIIINNGFNICRDFVPNSIVLAPGRSPNFYVNLLRKKAQKINVPVYAFATSCSPYFNTMPTDSEILGFREYLSEMGLNPKALMNAQKIFIVDFVDTGKSIQSLLLLFSHWAYDLENGQFTSAISWLKKYSNDDGYKKFKEKITIISISLGVTNLIDSVKRIPIKQKAPNCNISAKLYNNRYHCPLPSFPHYLWALPKEIRDYIFSNPHPASKTSIRMLEEMFTLCELLVELTNLIYSLDLDSGKLDSIGDRLMSFNEDFIAFPESLQGLLTLEQFTTSYGVTFVTQLVNLYPKYLQSTKEIGDDKEENTADGSLLASPVELDVNKNGSIDIREIHEAFAQHSRRKEIMEKIQQLKQIIEKPLQMDMQMNKSQKKPFNSKALLLFGFGLVAGVTAIKIAGKMSEGFKKLKP